MTRETLKVAYQKEEIKFDIWKRDLWSYCEELLSNRQLIGQFHWHAEKRFRHDGQSFVRFIDEPWTADAWWRIEVCDIFTQLNYILS